MDESNQNSLQNNGIDSPTVFPMKENLDHIMEPDLEKYRFCAEMVRNRRYFMIYGSCPSDVLIKSSLVTCDKSGRTIVEALNKYSFLSPFIEPGDRVVAMNGQPVKNAEALNSALHDYRGYFEIIIQRPGIDVSIEWPEQWKGERMPGKFIFHRASSASRECGTSVLCRELVVEIEDLLFSSDDSLGSQSSDSITSEDENDTSITEKRRQKRRHLKNIKKRLGNIRRKLEHTVCSVRDTHITINEYEAKQRVLIGNLQRSKLPSDVSKEMERMICYLPDQINMITNRKLLSGKDESPPSRNSNDGKSDNVKVQFLPNVESRKIKSDISPSRPLRRCNR